MDVARFENLRSNWTVQEVDRYSSAFAFGLLNAGYKNGDSIVLYVDQSSAAECFAAQLGASKVGVTVHTFAEKDDKEALADVLNTSRARGLIFSPATGAGENG